MNWKLQVNCVAAVAFTSLGCSPSGQPSRNEEKSGETRPGPQAVPATFELEALPLGLDSFAAKVPTDNPITPAKVELGKHLFFDGRLSRDGTTSCASCHNPAKGWSDGQKSSKGISAQFGDKNSPTIVNRLFSTTQFWDGRAKSLEEQALGPIANPIEMGNTLEGMLSNLNLVAGYKSLFQSAFGNETITAERVAQAIASFERTIVSGNSPFDHYEAGDKKAMSESAVRGLAIFKDNTKGRCSICHAGFNFTDEKFHNIGVGMDKLDWEKSHIGRFAVTKVDKDKGAQKTPTLRDVAASAPYMHDGSEDTLEAVVEYYARGGNPNPFLDPEMRKLTLTDQEKKDLVEFMKALTGTVTQFTEPVNP